MTVHNTTSLSSSSNIYIEEPKTENLKESCKMKAITDFKVVRGLGKGAFGQVYMVKDTTDCTCLSNKEKLYAMKIILKDSIKSP